MGSGTPTPREVVLLSFLLLSLIFFFQKHDHHAHQPLYLGLANNPLDARPKYDAPPSTDWDNRLSWGAKPVPKTSVLAHVPGWTVIDRLYIMKGVVYVVTDEPDEIPDIQHMYSKALYIENGREAEAARLPSANEIRLISTKEARQLFGTGAQVIDGATFLVNDPPQFITHYYHWAAELWFGLWRTYASLDSSITPEGNTTLPPPRRLMFNHLDAAHWRDYAAMDQWTVRSNFPSITMEFMEDWRERAELGTPFVFDRVVLADRSAAMLSFNYARYQRTASAAFALPGSVNWWMTLRNSVVQFAGLDPEDGGGKTSPPVITYISRQAWGRRMLIPEHHHKLVVELLKLRDTYGYEVNIVQAESMSRVEQIRLAARTTIMMGVHGNGLTSLLWMKPSPQSTVMEFFYPTGFAHDYEYTTRALGMTHYGFWDSHYFTSPDVPTPSYPQGFQGNSIPIDGEAVARLCVERLSLAVEVDD